MSRSEFFIIVECNDCGEETEIAIPEYNLRLGHTFVTECLYDMGWVVNSSRGVEYCPHCYSLEEDR